METQIVAKVKPEYINEIKRKTQGYSLRQNFTFIPKYHIISLMYCHGGDLMDFVKQVFLSDWGPWCPCTDNTLFIQVFNIYEPASEHWQVMLTRDRHDNKSVYVIHECTPRYGACKSEAAVSVRMYDLDDDGQFYSKEVKNELLEGAEGYSDCTWKSIDLKY